MRACRLSLLWKWKFDVAVSEKIIKSQRLSNTFVIFLTEFNKEKLLQVVRVETKYVHLSPPI